MKNEEMAGAHAPLGDAYIRFAPFVSSGRPACHLALLLACGIGCAKVEQSSDVTDAGESQVSSPQTAPSDLAEDLTRAPDPEANDAMAETAHDLTATAPRAEIMLFDGELSESLYPWFDGHGRADPLQVFSIEGNELRMSGEAWGSLTTRERYRDYAMVLEFRWGTKTWAPRNGKARDSGILVHSNGSDGGWRGLLMAGLHVQIMDGSLGDFIILAEKPQQVSFTAQTSVSSCTSPNWNCRGSYVCDVEGTESVFDKNLASVHWNGWDPNWTDVVGYRGRTVVESPDGDWNQLVVVADGDTLKIILNGITVNFANDVEPAEGQLQLESEYAEMFVRRWSLHPVDFIAEPVIQTRVLAAGAVGATYEGTVLASGMAAPLTWQVTDGKLPGGVVLDPNQGALTGVPEQAGTFDFELAITDASGTEVSAAFSIEVAAARAPSDSK